MSHVIYKVLDASPLWATGGDGVWIYDRDGNRYLDACGGVAVSSLGHNHPRVIEAIEREARRIGWAHAGTYTTPVAEELADLLAEQSGGLPHVQFLSGGSEAMELTLKAAYQYHWERGEPSRTIFISRRQSYHGSTLATLAITGNPQRRAMFDPLLGEPNFVSPCYAYRDQGPQETEADYATRLASELEDRIHELGPQNVAGFVAETVVGSTNGAVPPVATYFQQIKAVCERHGVLLILDEVMAGMGRTGHAFAYHEDAVVPDICAIGKGLAAGYQPISAILWAPHVHAAIAGGSGIWRNGQTHVNHPIACGAALAVQQIIQEDGLLEAVRARGKTLKMLLADRFAGETRIGDVRGRGLFVGVELVEDRATKAPCTGGEALVAAIKSACLARGLLTYPSSGTVDGALGAHVLFAPPFVATESDLEEMVDRFADGLVSAYDATQAAAL